jgi:hypothetical protein
MTTTPALSRLIFYAAAAAAVAGAAAPRAHAAVVAVKTQGVRAAEGFAGTAALGTGRVPKGAQALSEGLRGRS